ncbi:NRDE protein-domain-containing protein [Microdochium trichocladiopsis]|uniref:NRDE protein-domain-containing protein n=1 Tax=Microdochium trichocladiopsis TaxID=1682393 RepID=A0A9P8YJ42_9PEZI|nr:NRDE protein-domain-containing protein [Microdochium trichocladiopsis]KAH7040927.1 NRDE protein-domain-containing protein [Microdochium trichocladiopsis]
MCIVLLSTAHPRYALIIIDNRDEYVLRPTTQPYWWTHGPSGNRILSSRDLYRRERGTWMGFNQDGRFAVLTNFRESALDDPDKSLGTVMSRGVIVNEWLGAPPSESLDDFVPRVMTSGTFKGVGGFSLICGDLRGMSEAKGMRAASILSNRCDSVDQVPRICGTRGTTVSLSNTIYSSASTWPKVNLGEELMENTINEAVKQDWDEDTLTENLFSVLDHDTMPRDPDRTLAEFRDLLRTSIFIPPFNNQESQKCMEDAKRRGREENLPQFETAPEDDESKDGDDLEPKEAFLQGAYGTQRQTIILVDWDGNVTYKERALWDAHGNALKRGEADVVKKFHIGDTTN